MVMWNRFGGAVGISTIKKGTYLLSVLKRRNDEIGCGGWHELIPDFLYLVANLGFRRLATEFLS